MAFRSKSARRAIDELAFLVDRWQIEHVEAVDNILDMRYLNDMLPELADSGRQIRLFYEVKANLSRQQLKILRDAGVYRIQPGIESLSNHVLKLMRKGTTALRNVQLLKWCKELGILVDWNILYGFPGETRDDYDDILRILRHIRHFQPPAACGPIRLDRFSPYFDDPDRFGMVNVRPTAPYSFLYPFADAGAAQSRYRIAYYFDFDYVPIANPSGYADEVIAFVDSWRSQSEHGTLSAVQVADDLLLLDTRLNAVMPELRLSGAQRAVYEFCDEARTVASVIEHLHKTFVNATFDPNHVRNYLDSLTDNGLMLKVDKHYLSLAIGVPSAQVVPQGREPCNCLGERAGPLVL